MTIALWLLTDPASGGEVDSIAKTFGVDWPHLIAQTVSFSILCALLLMVAIPASGCCVANVRNAMWSLTNVAPACWMTFSYVCTYETRRR